MFCAVCIQQPNRLHFSKGLLRGADAGSLHYLITPLSDSAVKGQGFCCTAEKHQQAEEQKNTVFCFQEISEPRHKQPAPIRAVSPMAFNKAGGVGWFMAASLLLQQDGLLEIQIGDGGYHGPPVIRTVRRAFRLTFAG